MKKYSIYRISLARVARILALALLLPALSSCVTYYYPAPEYVDGGYDPAAGAVEGVYYAADDPGYTVSSVDYVGVSYYPWWSVDYFYLGYGYYGSGVSIGFSYGYPWWPTHSLAWYPYGYASWYYDPWRYGGWYRPPYYYGYGYGHHHGQVYWHVHNRHHRDRYDYHRNRPGYRPYDDGRYADNNGRGRDQRQPEPSDADFGHYRASGYGRDEIGSWDGSGGTQRRVTVAPGNGSTDRGMVISSRDGGKWSRSRLEPVGAARVTEPSAASSTTQPDRGYRTVRSGGTTVVSPAQSKVGRSKTAPVSEPVRAVPFSTAPVTGASSGRSAPVGQPAGRSREAPSYRGLSPSTGRPGATYGASPPSRSVSSPAPSSSRSAPSRSSAKAGSRSRVTPAPAKPSKKRKD
jgi:hypothetical protein